MKIFKKILNSLEAVVNDSLSEGLYNINKPINLGTTTVWIEDYDLGNNTFTVRIDGKSYLEHPNVEAYLSKALEERIPDLGYRLYVAKEEMKAEEENMRETEESICRSYGWSY